MKPIENGEPPNLSRDDLGTKLLPKGRLQRVTDWEAIAVQACYSSAALAQCCGVSLRHLQRHIRSTKGKNLGNWLNALRIEHGYRKLARGSTVKEAAYSLGFKQVSHFSRLFKKHYGYAPSAVPIDMTLGSSGEIPPQTLPPPQVL